MSEGWDPAPRDRTERVSTTTYFPTIILSIVLASPTLVPVLCMSFYFLHCQVDSGLPRHTLRKRWLTGVLSAASASKAERRVLALCVPSPGAE